MAATRVRSQDIKDGEVLVGDIGAAAVTFVKLSLAANPGLEDGGASVIQVKVAAPITLGAAGVGVSDFTSGSNNPGVRGTVPAPVLGDITKFLRGDGTWAAGGGVTGPGSSTDNAIVRWDGAGGTAIQDSAVTIDDTGAITAPDVITIPCILDSHDELTNGTFAADLSGWSVTGGAWAWNDAGGTGVARASLAGDLTQFAPTPFATYRVRWTLARRVTGGVSVSMGGILLAGGVSTVGTYTHYAAVNTAAALTFHMGMTGDLDIDNISVVQMSLPGRTTYLSAGLAVPHCAMVLGGDNQPLQRQTADGTVVGGDIRGANAMDFQSIRSAATQVASGESAFASGRNNTAAGSCCFAVGYNNNIDAAAAYGIAMGNANVLGAGASYTVALGYNNTCSAIYSLATGACAQPDHLGEHAHSCGYSWGSGTCQVITLTLSGTSSSATPIILCTNLSAVNRMTLAAGTIYACQIEIVAVKHDHTTAAYFIRQVLIERTGATTALVGAVQTIGVDINASGYAVAITADDVNDCLQIQATGAAATDLRWVATVRGTKVYHA